MHILSRTSIQVQDQIAYKIKLNSQSINSNFGNKLKRHAMHIYIGSIVC